VLLSIGQGVLCTKILRGRPPCEAQSVVSCNRRASLQKTCSRRPPSCHIRIFVAVAVVRGDVNVSGCVRELWLDADEAAGYMAAIEHPVHRVSTEDGRNLLLGG
jgi:hypothetical protein